VTDVRSARNALRIVKYLAEATRPTAVSTISRDLDIPRSSAYKLVGVLQSEGFVVHFPEQRTFGLASLVHELGTSTDRAERLRRLGAPLLTKLLHRVQLPVVAHLAVLHGSDVVYLAERSAARAPKLVSDVGVHLPAQLTATGRSLLSRLPHEQVRALYPSAEPLLRRGARGPRTVPELHDVLEETRRRGWALERDSVTEGMTSIAVAALDHNDYPVASIGVTFRTIAVDVHMLPSLAEGVRISAGALELRLRGRI
jgi:DNA-binding IclR family transcriptional regulator